MSFTRGDVRNDVRRRLEEFAATVISEADINQEFDNTLRDIEQKIDFRELQASDNTLTTVVDQQEYTLPATNIRKIIDIVLNAGTDDIQYVETDFNDRLPEGGRRGVNLGDTQTGFRYYLFGTTTIGLLPIPKKAGDIFKIYYQKFHPAVVDDTTTLSLPDIVKEAIVARISGNAMLADETIPNASIQTLIQTYDRLVGEARSYIENTSRKNSLQYKKY